MKFSFNPRGVELHPLANIRILWKNNVGRCYTFHFIRLELRFRNFLKILGRLNYPTQLYSDFHIFCCIPCGFWSIFEPFLIAFFMPFWFVLMSTFDTFISVTFDNLQFGTSNWPKSGKMTNKKCQQKICWQIFDV